MAKVKSKRRERIFTVFFMFAVTFVTISVISGIHLATADIVARNEKLFLQRAVCEAAGMPEFATTDELLAWYDECVRPVPDEEACRYYVVMNRGAQDVIGYVFQREGAGLWGTITAVVGLDKTLSRVAGVTFVKQNETPGLGARISEDWFKKQLRGKTGPFDLVPEGTQSAKPTDMDAVTGATITSTAVRDILNRLMDTAKADVASAPTDG